MKFFKFFKKRRYPYAPIAFLGRKNVEQMLGADIKKLKNINKVKKADKKASTEETVEADKSPNEAKDEG